jgi:hypothetical protein
MRLKFALAAALAVVAMPAWAQHIDRLQLLTQQDFRALSEDLGGTLS